MRKRLIWAIACLALIAEPVLAESIRVLQPGESFTAGAKTWIVPDSTYDRMLEAGLLAKNCERRLELATRIIGHRDQTIEYKSQQVILWRQEADHYRDLWRKSTAALIDERQRSRRWWRSPLWPFAGGVATTVAIAWAVGAVIN